MPDSGDPVNTTVYFSNTPVYTVDLTPETFSSNEYAYVDGGFWYTPKNFSSFYDSTWSVGSQHTLNIDSLEYPFSINSRFAFDSWSDGGAQSHTINLPAGSTSYIATVTPEFAPADNWQFSLPCGRCLSHDYSEIALGRWLLSDWSSAYLRSDSGPGVDLRRMVL